MKVCPTLMSLGLAIASAAPAATGQSRLESLIYQAVENLSTDELRLNALQRLENLGPMVVPTLRKRLHWQKRSDLTHQQQVDLLYVIGTLGKHGIPAMPELISWLSETDDTTLDQLLETFTYLAPHLDQEQLTKLQNEVCQYRSAKRRGAYWLIHAQAVVGAEPSATELITRLRQHGVYTTAACRKISAQPVQDADDAQLLSKALHQYLTSVTTRSFLSMHRGAASLSGELAGAWLAVSGRAPDAVVARGLLTHRLPVQRRRGILWLKENGRSLPAEQRCDVAVRLWDGDDLVVTEACRALADWHSEGALALAPLLHMAEQHSSKAVQFSASRAANTIGLGFKSAAPADQPWLLGAHAILLGQLCAVPATQPTPAGKRMLAEMMMLAQWNATERLANLLAFVDKSEPDRELVGTVYGWLTSTDPPLIDATLAWLANHAQHTVDIADSVRQDDPASRWQTFASWDVPPTCRGTAIEATAWFQTVDAVNGNFVDMLDSPNTRLQARGLAELLLRSKDQLLPVAARLRGLADLHHEQPLGLHISGFNRLHGRPYLLAEPVRMLAVMALARIGMVAKDQNGLGQLVKKHFACSLDDLPVTIATREKSGGLADQVEIFEAMCRRALYVPAQLVWPRAKQ